MRRSDGSVLGTLIFLFILWAIVESVLAWLRAHLALVILVALAALALCVAVVYLRRQVRARAQREAWERAQTLGDLLALTPAAFEHAVAGLLRQLGYQDVEHVGGPGDLAADIRCRDEGGRAVVVQCKRYQPGNRVGSREIQTFIGMMAVHHGADQGIFVTTSDFTGPARKLAGEHGIALIDGDALSRLVQANANRDGTATFVAAPASDLPQWGESSEGD